MCTDLSSPPYSAVAGCLGTVAEKIMGGLRNHVPAPAHTHTRARARTHTHTHARTHVRTRAGAAAAAKCYEERGPTGLESRAKAGGCTQAGGAPRPFCAPHRGAGDRPRAPTSPSTSCHRGRLWHFLAGHQERAAGEGTGHVEQQRRRRKGNQGTLAQSIMLLSFPRVSMHPVFVLRRRGCHHSWMAGCARKGHPGSAPCMESASLTPVCCLHRLATVGCLL